MGRSLEEQGEINAGGGIGVMAVTIDELQIEIQSRSAEASTGIDNLEGSLRRLKGTAKGGAGLTSTINQLKKLSDAISSASVPAEKIRAIVDALKPLSEIQKTNLGPTLNQLKRIPEVIMSLEQTDFHKFYNQIQSLIRIIKPLAAEMEKVHLGFSALPANIQRVIRANEKLTQSNRKTGKSFSLISGPLAKLSVLYLSLRRIAAFIGGWITESNAYVENLNLFTVSMGEFADEAKRYAENVGDMLGIDPSQWMRNQGVFMTLATGFGVATDKAALMSKNLTQLGYDLSSFFNIRVEDAMQKLQSGLAGELEPLRRLGFDLSQAKLEAIALANGIKMSVSEMTQAQKAQLRYYAIMTQVTTAHGDMARTLEAPANQLRIFQSQLTQAARALGNIFIPALNKVLPYAIAFLQFLRNIADEIANLFGFSLPEIDYSGVEGTGEAIEDTNEAAKELKNTLLGIDELNIIGEQDALKDLTDLPLELPEYDFLGDAVKNRAKEIAEELEKPFREILKTVGLIGAGILAWKIDNTLQSFFNKVGDSSVLTVLKNIAGQLMFIAGLAAIVYGAFDAITNGVTWQNLAMLIGGVAVAVGGLALMFGPVAAAIGLIVGSLGLLAIGIYDVTKNGLNLKNELMILAGLFSSGLGISILLKSPIPMLIVGLGAIVLGIMDICENGVTLQNVLMVVGGIIGITLVLALKAATAGAVKLGLSIGLAGLALGALAGAFLYISSVWDQMTGWEKVITIFTGLAAAVLAAALAIAVFHASWSMGLMVGVIVGSIAALAVAFAAVKNDVDKIAGTPGGIQGYGGGMQRAPAMGIGTGVSMPQSASTNQYSAQQANQNAGGSAFGSADSREIIRLLQEIAGKDTNIYLDGTKVSQGLYSPMQHQGVVYGGSLVR
jgi:hypothetical protein